MPRRLIVLADGTGNDAADETVTNIARLLDSLARTADQREPCYDAGVGAVASKLWSWLGLGFGLGLKRNVLQLYMFLSEHYQDDCHIYAFGFSRGAFTIRLLVDLIQTQGLLKGKPEDLPYLAGWAYRTHRRSHGGRALKALLAVPRAVRNSFLYARDWWHGRPGYNKADNVAPPSLANTVFVGVWDTVDAYGISIDMVARGIDRYLTPIRFDLHKVHPVVRRACHALSLDDERTSFHPVLWDEHEKVQQVWFAGVHADVGGGYPKRELSLVSLNWMIAEAAQCGLQFKQTRVDEWTTAADPSGEMHDSRDRFWTSLYRYGPRHVPRPEGGTGRPKIHSSVLTRIRNVKSYAPLAFPEHYDVVGDATPVADELGKPRRALGQEIARDLVWVRKGLYLLQLACAVSLPLAALAILVATVWTGWGPFPRVPFNTWIVLASTPESFKWLLLTPVILAVWAGWCRSGDQWLRARMNSVTQDAWAATSSATEPQLDRRTLDHAARGVRIAFPVSVVESVAGTVVPLVVGLVPWVCLLLSLMWALSLAAKVFWVG